MAKDKQFFWKSEDELSDIAQVTASAHVSYKGATEDFDSARVTVKFNNREVAKEFKAFLMRKGNVNKLDSLPKLEELANRQVQVTFSTDYGELCRDSLEKLGEFDLPADQVQAACSTLKLEGIGQGQKRGISR